MDVSFGWQYSWYHSNPRKRKRRTNEVEAVVEIRIAREGVAQASSTIEDRHNWRLARAPQRGNRGHGRFQDDRIRQDPKDQ